MDDIPIFINTPDETVQLGKTIGSLCKGGEVFLLDGTLGAGKTCFTKGLALGLGLSESISVTSPTFTLHKRYETNPILDHIDAYRLEGMPDAGADTGFDEFLGHPGHVCAVEWPDYINSILPGQNMRIAIDILGKEKRCFHLHPFGKIYETICNKFS